MIKLNATANTCDLKMDLEMDGKSAILLTELTIITQYVVYKMSNNKEEFEIYSSQIADLLNKVDYETVKETFNDGLQ